MQHGFAMLVLGRLRERTAREMYGRTLVLRQALSCALPCAFIAVGLKQVSKINYVKNNQLLRELALFQVLNDSAAYSGFALVLGFLVVFRTQLAYNRFWEGVSAANRMCAEWFDSASSVLAFTKISKADKTQVFEFERKFIKFFSLLHGVAVSSLRDLNNLQLLDVDLEGLSPESIKELQSTECPATVIFQWVQEITIQAMDDKVLAVPPPILSRVFNEIANGMVAYHDCIKIQSTNVPLPYKQMTIILMAAHWFTTPVVMCMWTKWATWTFILTLIQSMIFWCLYFTAHQIECPFHTGELSCCVVDLHQEFISNLLAMVRSKPGELVSSPEDFDPETWIHRMKSLEVYDEESGKHLSKRGNVVKNAPSPKSSGIHKGSNIDQASDTEGSVQVKMETPCRPQMDSGETWVASSGAGERCISGCSAEVVAITSDGEQQPIQENPECGTDRAHHLEGNATLGQKDRRSSRNALQVKSLAELPRFFPVNCSCPSKLTDESQPDKAVQDYSEDMDEGALGHGRSMRCGDSLDNLVHAV